MSPTGDPLCRVCFNGAQMAAQQVRATEEQYGLEVTGQGQGLGGRLRKMGWVLIVMGVPVALLGIVGGRRAAMLGGLMIAGGISMIVRARSA